MNAKEELIKAEKKAIKLFEAIESSNMIIEGKSERELNEEVFALAKKMFGIEKYWHKRIVRSGPNTLHPYNENPPDLVVQTDDILFFDFDPIFEQWEADLGRTYVVGNDADRRKLKHDVEAAWYVAQAWFKKQSALSCSQYYNYAVRLAKQYGWEFGGEIAGHLIGQFPHERLEPGNFNLYVHPDSHTPMLAPDANGNERNWILELHFVDREKQIGGFFEQLLTN